MRWSAWKRGGMASALIARRLARAPAQEPAPAAPKQKLLPRSHGLPAAPATSTAEWHDAASVQRALQAVASAHKDFARAGSYGRSLSGKELGFVELGPVDDPQRSRLPALLIVAGLDGQHLVGTEMALDLLKRLADGYGKDPAVTKLLDDHVVYVIPRANPDGAERFFDPIGGARREIRGNLSPVDDDRDGTADEDGPEDLNKDGVITQMRWKDPAGTWIEDKDEPRLLRPADPLKGERGVYKVRTEGLDRDGDGASGPRTGRATWSPTATSAALASTTRPPAACRCRSRRPRRSGRFVWERQSLALVVVFGLHDNLSVDAKADSSPDAGGGGGGFRFSRTMPTGIVKDDLPIWTELATRYREATGVTSKPPLTDDDGSFWSWTYFQLGVPTLCMHVWSPPLDVVAPPKEGEPKKEGPPTKEGEGKKEGDEKKDGEAKKEGDAAKPSRPPKPPAQPPETPPPAGAPPAGAPPAGGGGRRGGGGGGGGRRGGPGGGAGGPGDAKPAEKPTVDPDEKKVLIWNDQKMGGAAFLPWTKVAHPTLGEVEVGGWKPYVRVNPPLPDVAELAKKHGDFVLKLGELFAQVKLTEIKVENLGGGLFRVKTTVVNDGWLPTVTVMGERGRPARPTRLDLDLGKATLVQGEARHTWSRIEGAALEGKCSGCSRRRTAAT